VTRWHFGAETWEVNECRETLTGGGKVHQEIELRPLIADAKLSIESPHTVLSELFLMRTVSFMALLLLAWLAIADQAGAAAPSPPTAGLGRKIEAFTLHDYRGKSWTLAELQGKQGTVVVFVGVECPIAGQYASRLQELAGKYAEAGIAFVAIDANQQDSLTELAHFARTRHIEFPVLKDLGNKVADQFGAERTPEAYLLDRDNKIAFSGRIDDQFTYGIQRAKVERTYLSDAIDQLVAGQPIAMPHADAIGCRIGRVLAPKSDSNVTYSRQIARLFQDRCVNCHRAGEIGPFSLTSYDDAVGWAEMIREVVAEQRMPPWHANPKYGHFINDSRLSEEEKQLIYRWVDAGAPEGNKADLPPPREFTVGWQIGEPNQVVYIAEKPFDVPAKGEVRYQYFFVDPGFKEDKWIQAAECRPGNRAVVHHIIVGVVPPGQMRPGQRVGDLGSDWLAATAPGARPMVLREGMAKLVPAGGRLVFQMHYTPNGTAQQDRSCIGLVFADPKSVKMQIATDKAATQGFNIPPGADNHKVEATRTFASDTLVLALFPHMHVRGKAFRYTAIYPDGEREVLLDVPHYDFNWQNSYEFAEAKRMPKGAKIFCEAWYDNSENNLANPDPTKSVRWGDQTWEEMMIGYFSATPADQDLQAARTKAEAAPPAEK
jgi:peroxiredoxin/mono/diheme cytochrome c family protein